MPAVAGSSRMDAARVAASADQLLAAEGERRTLALLTSSWPELDVATAYAIQDETMRRRLARGELAVGVKLGLTSKAKQQSMGVDVPLVAWLTDRMALEPGMQLPASTLIHPRVEPEIVVVLGSRLAGPGVDAASAMAGVAEVRAGLEVIDSRYADFNFTLPDVIADNASAARFILGEKAIGADGTELAAERCELFRDDERLDEATGAATMGGPGNALALAANVLAERGLALEPGWVVLTGGLTDAVPLEPGSTITANYEHLGTVSISAPAADP